MSSFAQPPLFLQELLIRSFRNIAELTLSFEPGANLFIGHNGHGKTNCLEAIALSLSLRPMQSLQNIDLIKFDDPSASLKASFLGPHAFDLSIEILPHGKKARLNQQAIKNTSSIGKFISLVSFIPAELAMIQGAASLRRRALDQAATSLFYEHINALKAYEKILAHRNKLLKSWPLDHQSLKVFTELLIKEGALVIYFRLKTLEAMQDIFARTIKQILGQQFSGQLEYSINDETVCSQTPSDLMGRLEQNLSQVASLEHKRKLTLFGPHLDDLVLSLNGYSAKKTASRGQSRALVLAFKLAHMLAAEHARGAAPILILDDIVSELDQNTKANLFLVVAELKTQSFFSATDLKTFGGQLDNGRIFELKEGALL